MKLSKLRDQWEKNAEVVLNVTKNTHAYPVVYVVLAYEWETTYLYKLHRYFRLGNKWEVSVDATDVALEHCLKRISKAFEEDYPNE